MERIEARLGGAESVPVLRRENHPKTYSLDT
jgi:hypothetical protein